MGFRILLLTCYDLRFPLWSRYAEDLKYDMIICVANWPESRQNAWQILTRARAIENQAFVVACNRVGDDKYCHYRGQSAIISPIGKTLVNCPPNKESSVSFFLNLESLVQQRAKFKVLDDRDIK
jgi:predicted amidohydrolase